MNYIHVFDCVYKINNKLEIASIDMQDTDDPIIVWLLCTIQDTTMDKVSLIHNAQFQRNKSKRKT